VTLSATLAIVSSRVQRQLRQTVFAVCAASLLSALQLHSGEAAQAIGATLFGSLIAISASLSQRGAQMRDLELCEQSAPLYGRELARAGALAPCITVTFSLFAYWLVALASPGTHFAGAAISIACANAVALVALCATLRSGTAQALYIGVCAIIAVSAAGLHFAQPIGALALCVIAGFVALRQYGEALARFDPI
jgi:hypothetical protein